MKMFVLSFFIICFIFFYIITPDVFGTDTRTETKSIFFDDREITIYVKVSSVNFQDTDNKQIKIFAHDKTNNKDIQNVTYFISISDNDENLLRQYFFAKDGTLIMDVIPNLEPQVKVIGEKQYAHDAYVMSDKIPIQIIGSIFELGKTYTFDMELRTIDDPANWVFSLSGFQTKITIGGIPDWVKNNAKWWSKGIIDDDAFANGIEYLIQQRIILVPSTESASEKQNRIIPEWVRNNAALWADDQIDDKAFVGGIQFLIKEGIISV